MGLAAKLAAADQQSSGQFGAYPQPNYSQQPPPHGQYGQPASQDQYGQPPPQGQYGSPSPQGQYVQPPPQGQYGLPPPQGQYVQPPPQGQYDQPAYGVPPQPTTLPGLDPQSILRKLSSIVDQNGLQVLYPAHRLQQLAQEVSQKDLAGLARRWRLQPNLVLDLTVLALYDVVIMADDSGSMTHAEGGERVEDLKAMLSRIADAAALFDSDGISVRFMNSDLAANNLRNADEIKAFVDKARFGGLTPLGTMLDRKIVAPFVIGPAKSMSLRKPVLAIIITDGEPTGESSDAVRSTIKSAKKTLSNSQYGSGAVAFSFAQVGRDEDATKFLGKLDCDSKIGGMVDATSYIELEQEEFKKKGIDLTVDVYMVKLLVGAIDSSWDEQDEVKKAKRKSLLGSLFK